MEGNTLQLGDIIQIISPKNDPFHNKRFYIYHYDPKSQIQLINIDSLEMKDIGLPNGFTTEMKFWETIRILSRSKEKGFARQNGLLPKKWVELEFYSDVRVIVTAQIQYLEEDMITLIAYPNKEIIYIDFGYKGMPKDIHLRNICLCAPPSTFVEKTDIGEGVDPRIENEQKMIDDIFGEDSPVAEVEQSSKVLDTGEIEYTIPAMGNMELSLDEKIESEILSAVNSEEDEPGSVADNGDEDTEDDDVYYNRKPFTIRYNIEVQLNDLLDTLVYQLPEHQRNRHKMKTIYKHVVRFKELRDAFSTVDKNGKVVGYVSHNPLDYKPMVEKLYDLRIPLTWLYPVVRANKNIFYEKEETYHEIMNEKNKIEELFRKEDTVNFHDLVKYKNMLTTLGHTYWKPYHNTDSTITLPIASNIPVLHDIDAILTSDGNDNNDNLLSPNFKRDSPGSSQYCVVQRIHSSIPYSKYISKMNHKLEDVMESEKVDIDSMILLPESYRTQFGKAHETSTILEKIQFNAPYLFNLLRKKRMSERIVSSETVVGTEMDESDAKNGPIHIKLDQTYEGIFEDSVRYPAYKTLLQKAIPNIFDLLNQYERFGLKSYSIAEYIKILSPYYITREHLSFKSTNKILYNIRKNLKTYKHNYDSNKTQYNYLSLLKLNHLKFNNKYYETTYFQDDSYSTVLNDWIKYYNIPFDRKQDTILIRNDELLGYMYKTDDLKYFTIALLRINSSLISPVIMGNYIEPHHFYDMEQKAIAKYYSSLLDMQKDNHKQDLKYDAKYDANQYAIMDKLKTQKSTMQAHEFFDFLVQKLSTDYGCSMQNTESLAAELIQGFKLVREGDYALLESKQPLPIGIDYCDFTEDEKKKLIMESNVVKVQKYFKRVNNIWVYDKDVDSTSFAKPAELTCDLKDTDLSKRYVENIEKLMKNIERQYNKEKERVILKSQIRKQHKFIHDQYHSILGNKIYSHDAVISPHQATLERIRNDYKYDFHYKQEELYRFKEKYCRDPTDSENQYWFYCKQSETSIPLMPRVEYELARAFKNGVYNETLVQLKKFSKVSDGVHYDIHTGYSICEVDFLDQGMESVNIEDGDDDQATAMEPILNREIIVENDNSLMSKYHYTELIYVSIIKKIADKISIPLHWIEFGTIQMCRIFVNDKSFFEDKKTYEMKLEKFKNKHKGDVKVNILSYNEYYYDRILILIVCCMILNIQTDTSSVFVLPRNKSGVNNCIPTFDGYPLLDEPDKKGIIHYIRCVLRTMKDKTTAPWKHIKQKEDVVENKIKSMFRDVILQHETIRELIEKKRNYLETQRQQLQMEKKEVNMNWTRFLPPLKRTSIVSATDSVQEITKSVNERFSISIRDGNAEQWKYYGLYFGKSILFSVSISEMMNEVIQTKQTILGNNSTFTILENACCHELENPLNPIEYFQKENDKISNYYVNVKKIEKVFHKLKQYSTAISLLPEPVHNRNHHATKYDNKSPSCLYDEILIYKTFIRYFHLKSFTKPIPSFLKPFLNTKPIININSSIEEIIQDLKESENKVDLSLTKFNTILSTVNLHNVLRNTYEPLDMPYNLLILESWEKLKEIELGDGDNPIVPIYNTLQEYFEGGEKQNELLRTIENEFENQITRMKTKLTSILEKEYSDKLFALFDNIWADLSPISMGNAIKNFIYHFSTMIPSFLIDGNTGHENFSQWKLMKDDKEKFRAHLKSKFEPLSSFNKTSESDYTAFIQHVKDIQPSFKILHDNISLFYGCFPKNNSSLYKRYFRFCVYYTVFRMFSIRDSIYTTIIEGYSNNEDDEDNNRLDSSMERVYIESQNEKIQKKMLKLLEKQFIHKNIFEKNMNTLNNYDDIQKNNYKLKHKEKENVMSNFTTDNKKQIASEKALKKLRIGKYYTNLNVVQTYGNKRDKMLFDANINQAPIDESDENDEDNLDDWNEGDELNGFTDINEEDEEGDYEDDEYDEENHSYEDNEEEEGGYDMDPDSS
jgi:hypothetical protein